MIHSTIVNSLLDADLVVADLTDHNPNVLFELGMRLHTDKPVALVQARGTARIFDVDNLMRVYAYNPNLWPSTLVKAAWDDQANDATYLKLLRRAAAPA